MCRCVEDGNDLDAIEDAIEAAKADTTQPSLIRVRTVIGYGSPKAGTQQGARRSAGRGGGEGDQEEPGLAGGQELLCAGGGRARTG